MTDNPFRDRIEDRMREMGDNTIWLEAVFEQGRDVNGEDITEINEFVADSVVVWAETMASRPDIRQRDIFCVAGTERPDDEEFFGVDPSQRIHCFIRVREDQLNTQQANGLRKNIARAFEGDEPLQDRPPDAAVGRGFRGINIVDTEIVNEAIPQLTGPAREDVELL